MRRARVGVAGTALALAALALTTGCGTQGLSFQQDQRVRLLEPPARADVTLPLTIRWSVDDFESGPGAGSFGIVIDRTPPPPGRDLGWVFRDDDNCGATGCPDVAYRATQGVYQTDATEVVVTSLLPRTDRGDADEHEVTVILLDEQGKRIGEGSWTRRFDVTRVGP